MKRQLIKQSAQSVFVIFLIYFLVCTSAFAADGASGSSGGGGSYPWSFVGRKAEVKRQSRWSLDEWLATREKFKWMDMWLALNYPSPYEFFILGAYNSVPESLHGKTDLRWGLGAYAKIFGLEFEHDTIFTPEDHARFHLRIFGYNVQNTNLTLHAGIRQRHLPATLRQGYVGASMTAYFQKFFGIYVLYRYYMEGAAAPFIGAVSGPRFEAGPFIDFGPLRIFGNYVFQREGGSSPAYSVTANGWDLGAQLFF